MTLLFGIIFAIMIGSMIYSWGASNGREEERIQQQHERMWERQQNEIDELKAKLEKYEGKKQVEPKQQIAAETTDEKDVSIPQHRYHSLWEDDEIPF